MRGTWSAVGALLLLGLAAPTGEAQGDLGPELVLAVDAPTGAIKPEVESPFLVLVVTARCDAVLARAPAAAPEDVPLTVTFTLANGVVITGPSQVGIDPQLCLQPATTEVTIRQPYQVTVPRTAPGLQATAGTVNVMFGFNPVPGLPETPATPLNFVVNVDYYALSQAKVASKLKSCDAPCGVDFDIEVTNFGNARTQYTFELASEPGGKWNAQLPEVLLVDSPNSGLGSPIGIATFHVRVPWAAGEGSYELIIRPSAADDPAKEGNPMTVNVLVRDTSFASKATPLPAPMWAGLALLAIALLARRRA